MITEFIKADRSPRFDVVFIDEAQDLSLSQWDMARSIWDKTGDTFIAGDDDQAIFRWAGADVDSFITQTGRLMQLTQSYRIPQVVHDIASRIVNKIQNRGQKYVKKQISSKVLLRPRKRRSKCLRCNQ